MIHMYIYIYMHPPPCQSAGKRVHSVFGFLVPSSLFHAMYDMYLCYVCYVYAYACHVGSRCAVHMCVCVCA